MILNTSVRSSEKPSAATAVPTGKEAALMEEMGKNTGSRKGEKVKGKRIKVKGRREKTHSSKVKAETFNGFALGQSRLSPTQP